MSTNADPELHPYDIDPGLGGEPLVIDSPDEDVNEYEAAGEMARRQPTSSRWPPHRSTSMTRSEPGGRSRFPTARRSSSRLKR